MDRDALAGRRAARPLGIEFGRRRGAYNLAGVRSSATDAVIDALLAARSQEDFVAAARALDRLLISGFYIVPLFYAPQQWIAYSAKARAAGAHAAVRRRPLDLVASGVLTMTLAV